MIFEQEEMNNPRQNEVISERLIQQNEKERALEIYRQRTASELKNEYDRKVMDLTKDF